jgi:hypothetical protein
MTELIPVKLAFIIDNEVVEIMNTDNRLAAIFLSEPTIVEINEEDGIYPGMTYDKESNSFAAGL